MLNQIETARALKDQDYFHSLPRTQQKAVLAAGGIGSSNVSDESLQSVSSGLEGGAQMRYTGTDRENASATTMVICTC
jgi:hypothetical protein